MTDKLIMSWLLGYISESMFETCHHIKGCLSFEHIKGHHVAVFCFVRPPSVFSRVNSGLKIIEESFKTEDLNVLKIVCSLIKETCKLQLLVH